MKTYNQAIQYQQLLGATCVGRLPIDEEIASQENGITTFKDGSIWVDNSGNGSTYKNSEELNQSKIELLKFNLSVAKGFLSNAIQENFSVFYQMELESKIRDIECEIAGLR